MDSDQLNIDIDSHLNTDTDSRLKEVDISHEIVNDSNYITDSNSEINNQLCLFKERITKQYQELSYLIFLSGIRKLQYKFKI